MKPTRGKALIEIIPDPSETASGLYIHHKKDVPHRGIVLSVGKPSLIKGKESTLDIKGGDIVHFKRQWEKQRKLDKKEILIVKQEDLIAKESNGTLKAFRDEVVIERIFDNSVNRSSLIIIPELDETKSNSMDFHGKVISVGNKESLGVEVGMNIAYHRNEGLKCEIPNDRTEYFVLKPRAILAELV